MNGSEPNAAKSGAPCPSAQDVCPLSSVQAGTFVRIKQLNGSHEVALKLRELGFCEEQRVKLLLKHTNTSVICQVCNARIGLSARMAETIMVEQLHGAKSKAA